MEKRLVPVNGTQFVYLCCGCREIHTTKRFDNFLASKNGLATYADINGPSFKAYHCALSLGLTVLQWQNDLTERRGRIVAPGKEGFFTL